MSLSADPPAPLFRGADQPMYRAFAIDGLRTETDLRPVIETLVHQTPFLALRRFELEASTAPDVLLVPPLSGHFPLIMRDVVLGLLPKARVTVIDWFNARHLPVDQGTFGFADNIRAVTDAILRIGPGASVVALCQGGVPALAAVADMANRMPEAAPRLLALIAAPIDPLANPTPVVALIRRKPVLWYSIVPLSRVGPDYAGHGRWVFPAEVQLASLKKYRDSAEAHDPELLRKLREDDGRCPDRFPFGDLYTSVMDLDARHYAENIETVFINRRIADGTLTLRRGVEIDPGAIRNTLLLTIEGEADPIAAPGQTAAAHALCRNLPESQHRRLVVPNCGHFGLFHGALARDVTCPAITSLIAD